MADSTAGQPEVQAHLGALAELSARLASVDDAVAALTTDVSTLSSGADSVIGVDGAARVFRAGFFGRVDDVAAAADRAAAAVNEHRARIDRGLRDLGSADADSALRLGPS